MFPKSIRFSTLLLYLCTMIHIAWAQADSLSLDDCYRLAKTNYPAIKKLDLIARTRDFDIQNAGKRFFPQLNFSGQATYQSQTVSFSDALGSLPAGATLPTISKDQYKIQGDLNQLVYDAGVTRYQKELIKANAALQEQSIETNLYTIRSRINNIFFSILLMGAQLRQNELNKASLQTQVQKTEAAVTNGIAFRSNVDELKAEILNIEMASTEYKANRMAYFNMLALFTGSAISVSTTLKIPAEYTPVNINRPELKTFDIQKSVFDVQEKQLKSDYAPQVSAFFQGAYGRPTLNILENKFGPWYITGLRFNWSLGSLYTLSNKKTTLNLNRQSVEADRETFLLNTKVDLTQQDEQVSKYKALIQQDNEAIDLRTSVTKSAEAQLGSGVITTHEYIQKMNAEHLARQTKILHEIQLLQAQYNQKFISGN